MSFYQIILTSDKYDEKTENMVFDFIINNTSKLDFVIEWLNSNRNENGNWDMGSTVNDKVYFPLPDSWRKKTYREKDCTFRIQNLVRSLSEAKEDRM